MRSPEDILDEYAEEGTLPTPPETVMLCEEAIAGRLAQAQLAALVETLEKEGWATYDNTTDDDERMLVELVPLDDD